MNKALILGARMRTKANKVVELEEAIEELNKGEIKILPEDYEPELETEETEEAE